MEWVVLIIAGIMEAGWAISLDKSNGFTQLEPTLAFFALLTGSMIGLAYAMKTLPLSIAYVIWGGIGTAITVGYAFAFGGESITLLKLSLLLGIICCVAGLKLVSEV